MKTTSRIILTLASVLAFTGAAQAVTFTVSDITVGSAVGSTTDFKWSVAGKPSVASFDLLAGNSFTFTYGTFNTTDFSLDANDIAAQNDYFSARFKVSPPTPAVTMSDTGYVDAYQTIIPAVTETYAIPAVCSDARYTTQSSCTSHNKRWTPATTGTRTVTPESTTDYALVNFSNVVNQSFGNTGSYTLTFNDINGITKDGTYDLTATIALISDITPEPSAVPEPGTMMLVGMGMFGMAVYGKRRASKA